MVWAFGLLLLLVFVLSLGFRCKLRAEFRQDKLFIWLCLFGATLRLYPRAGNRERRSGESYGKQDRPPLSVYFEYARLLLRQGSRLAEKVRLERLEISFLSAFGDPYETVQGYNLAALLFSALQGIPHEGKELRLSNALDFERRCPELQGELCASLPMGRLAVLLTAALLGKRKLLRAVQEG